MKVSNSSSIYIGLMSGTSLDGVDGVVVAMPSEPGQQMQILGTAHIPFDPDLRAQGLALQQSGVDEIHREALFANAMVEVYAACVAQLQSQLSSQIQASRIRAIGVHGQTIRHRPELGYTRQTNNPALLAERCGIDVIADFRSRDVAAGGQGAPLVPAFHRAIFGVAGECRVVVNIGGISNISILHSDGRTSGFDTGPGNVLMDAWIERQHGLTYDADGAWARSGRIHHELLASLCAEVFFDLSPPKSTGRDLFHLAWLQQKLQTLHAATDIAAADVQASLCALTARAIASEIARHAPDCQSVFVCGGGAFNSYLMQELERELHQQFSAHGHIPKADLTVQSTLTLGVAPDQVEALAFAWLAQCFVEGKAGNVAEVTGAKGPRILGALYPA